MVLNTFVSHSKCFLKVPVTTMISSRIILNPNVLGLASKKTCLSQSQDKSNKGSGIAGKIPDLPLELIASPNRDPGSRSHVTTMKDDEAAHT